MSGPPRLSPAWRRGRPARPGGGPGRGRTSRPPPPCLTQDHWHHLWGGSGLRGGSGAPGCRRIQLVVATVPDVGGRCGREGWPPAAPRDVRVRFWEGMRAGLGRWDAGRRRGWAGGSQRWFTEAGGVKANGPGPVSGRYLSLAEREEIAVGLAAGESLRHDRGAAGAGAVDGEPGGGAGTARAGVVPGAGGAGPGAAAGGAGRRRRSSPGNAELRELGAGQAGENWSPEQISLMLAAEFPGRPEMRVSHETIYQSIYVQGRGALRRELAACLRTGRALRKPRRKDGERRGRIPGMVNDQRAAGGGRGPGGARALGGRPDHRARAAGRRSARWWSASTRFVMLLHLPPRARTRTGSRRR